MNEEVPVVIQVIKDTVRVSSFLCQFIHLSFMSHFQSKYFYTFLFLFQNINLKTYNSPDCLNIRLSLQTLIKNGAFRLVVPGQFPFGCFPIHLTLFQSNDSTDYDEFHCLKSVNNIFMHHNKQLQQALQELRQEYPHAIIIYGDYYNGFLWLFRNAPYFGN